MKRNFVLFSDSVTRGHPDKLCDQISDAIVDEFLRTDPHARVIAECAVATGVLFIATQYHADEVIDVPEVARQVIEDIGYRGPEFNARDCTILSNINEMDGTGNRHLEVKALSEQALDKITATHQVTLFGFACNHNEAYLPHSIWLAHELARQLDSVRHEKALAYLLPDGQSQVGVEFRDYMPHEIHSVSLLTSQRKHDGPAYQKVIDDMHEQVIEPVLNKHKLNHGNDFQIYINPDGPLLSGGPSVHAGLTGRKNAIDTYGQFSRHSGAALSGKDPTRIDRIGAYYARYVAKNIVAAKLADLCEVQLSYTIGKARPVSLQLETYGTAALDEAELLKKVQTCFDFRVGAIIQAFRLYDLPASSADGFYRKLACYGHVGRLDLDLPWEKLDKVEQLRN